MIPYGRQTIEADDIQAVSEVLTSDWLTQGPKVREFESQFSEYVGSRYSLAVNNGTSALFAACHAVGFYSVPRDDEFDYGLTTPLTFAATANAIEMAGGSAIFQDIDETWNM